MLKVGNEGNYVIKIFLLRNMNIKKRRKFKKK